MNTTENQIKEVFTALASGFCHFPTALRVTVTVTSHSVCVCFASHADDVRKLVGKKGAMHRSLEILLRAIASRHQLRARLIVDEPYIGEAGPAASFEPNQAWLPEKVARLYAQLAPMVFKISSAPEFKPVSADSSTMICRIGFGEHWPTPSGLITDDDLADALSRIFDSIGRADGRKIYVELERRAA